MAVKKEQFITTNLILIERSHKIIQLVFEWARATSNRCICIPI